MIRGAIPQLRTTDLEASIRFWTEMIGLELAFRYGDFYAGLRAGAQEIHLKLVDEADPSIPYVAAGGHLHLWLEADDVDALAAAVTARGIAIATPPHDTPWNTREFVLHDDQGHTIHIGRQL